MFFALASARIYLSPSGNESWRSEFNNSFLHLSNSTLLAAGESEPALPLLETLRSLLNETRALRARVELLEAKPPACGWNGTFCSCYFNSSSIPDAMITTAATCLNGALVSVQTVGVFLATGIFNACNLSEPLWDFSMCDGFF